MSQTSLETWQWTDRWRDVRVSFTGRDHPEAGDPPGIAWLEQIHSADVLASDGPGRRGRGDALTTDRLSLGLRIVTADCVPVLLATDRDVAAVHAGWRGVASDIVGATCGRLGSPPQVAWIGPGISGEVYEVSDEVAERVAAASGREVVLPGRGERPHVDLRHAVRIQLERCGAQEIRTVDECTFMRRDILCSYRRDGAGAGRNRSTIWRRA